VAVAVAFSQSEVDAGLPSDVARWLADYQYVNHALTAAGVNLRAGVAVSWLQAPLVLYAEGSSASGSGSAGTSSARGGGGGGEPGRDVGVAVGVAVPIGVCVVAVAVGVIIGLRRRRARPTLTPVVSIKLDQADADLVTVRFVPVWPDACVVGYEVCLGEG
jgi:hypothetical protein